MGDRQELIHEIKEIQWAHIYHDSIRGIPYLQNLSINVGRWAGSYAFFYVLCRILKDFKPKKILELGLGESTKVVSAFLNNSLIHSNSLVLEQDLSFIDYFKKNNAIADSLQIKHCPIIQKKITKHIYFGYDGIEEIAENPFDFYIVDGPHGSDRFSRYDALPLISSLKKSDQFILLMDDTNRIGEQDTLLDIKKYLYSNDIEYFFAEYQGNKSSAIIATSAYKYATSL